jgi:predicted RNase H-like nuclease (RuvC/YqgF family)
MSIQAGKENERKWEEYWGGLRSQGKYLPIKANGEVNVAQVGRDSKIGRENLYKNLNIYPKLLAAIEETLKAEREAARVRPESDAPVQVNRRSEDAVNKQLEARDRRIRELEERVAVLAAENHELRRQVKNLEDDSKRYEFIENMVSETGRRIIPR